MNIMGVHTMGYARSTKEIFSNHVTHNIRVYSLVGRSLHCTTKYPVSFCVLMPIM